MDLSVLRGLGSAIILLSGIVILFRLFQQEGFLKGVLGLICMLYTYIWGWQNINREELKLKTWMYLWTGAIVVGLVLNVVGMMGGGGG